MNHLSKVAADPRYQTPVELRGGIWYKREDAFRVGNVNGQKLRAAFHLALEAKHSGYTRILSAASVISPQNPIAATVASSLGMESITVIGGTTPEKAAKGHDTIREAARVGTKFIPVKVGYNPYLQSQGALIAERDPQHTWQLNYGISPGFQHDDIERFAQLGVNQVANLPDTITDLILPFGSGNSSLSVLYGMHALRSNFPHLEAIHLMTVGPDKRAMLEDRLQLLIGDHDDLPIVQHFIFPDFATYAQSMHESLSGIDFHPHYEGKVIRYLNERKPPYWLKRDGTVAFWIVGSELGTVAVGRDADLEEVR